MSFPGYTSLYERRAALTDQGILTVGAHRAIHLNCQGLASGYRANRTSHLGGAGVIARKCAGLRRRQIQGRSTGRPACAQLRGFEFTRSLVAHLDVPLRRLAYSYGICCQADREFHVGAVIGIDRQQE